MKRLFLLLALASLPVFGAVNLGDRSPADSGGKQNSDVFVNTVDVDARKIGE